MSIDWGWPRKVEHGAPSRTCWDKATAVGLLIATAAWLGCGEAAQDSALPTVRDSAGIRIVQNHSGFWGDADTWRLAESPLVQIGALEGNAESQLFQVRGAVRLSDGRIVVSNAGTQQLRFYTSDGEHLRTVGGQGDGPGEFRGLGSLELLPGDSILAGDFRLRRVTIFDSRGDFVRSSTIQVVDGNVFPRFAGRFPDGSLLVSTGRVFTPDNVGKGGVTRDSVLYLKYNADGSLADTLGRFLGQEFYVKILNNNFMVTSPPFGRSTVHAMHSGRLYVGTNDTYEIRSLDADGVLRQIIRRTHDNVPVTQNDIERLIDSRTSSIDNDDERQMMRGIYEEMPFPETLPAFMSLRVDADGNLWVQEYAPRIEDALGWTVFRPDGVMLGVVEMPPRFTPYEIGAGFVLGKWTDEFDVEYVQLYELHKP